MGLAPGRRDGAMNPRVLVVRSEENPWLLGDLRHAYPDVLWLDGPMPFLPGRGESPAERPRLLATLDGLYARAGSVDAVLYARAYGAFSAASRDELAARAPAPLRTAPGAVQEALRTLGAQRVFALTPYGQARHDDEVAWLGREGFTVLASACLGRDEGAAIGQIRAAVLAHGVALAEDLAPQAQAVYVACTVLRTLRMPLMASLPVVTATGAVIAQIFSVLGASA